ncbi:hypothetical protein QUB68_05075 [Microcoleus sp. A006_D1]|uniref:hypothetical protein n=1 Tax=Microcoleus sp. A006_D1 TaxID=3055267 RepID=UPI002FCFDDD6
MCLRATAIDCMGDRLLIGRRKKEEGRGKKEEGRGKKEEGFSYRRDRRKKTYTASFLAIGILPLIRWIYLFKQYM